MAKFINNIKAGVHKDNWLFNMFRKIRAAGYRYCEVFFLTNEEIDNIKGLTAFNYRVIHFLQRIYKEARTLEQSKRGI